jgi:hypothetical protein
MLHAM